MYKNFIFDLYGTLIDINTDEGIDMLWEKMAILYGYNEANYTPEEFKNEYFRLAGEEEQKIVKMNNRELGRSDVHEAHPEIQLEYVFQKLFTNKGVEADMDMCIYMGQCFRVLSTRYIKLYEGTREMLDAVRKKGGKIYLLSNAQKIFTIYEMKMLGIYDCFDGIYISSDKMCKKPDVRFMQMLLDEYSLDVNESIMVGNDLRSDIGSANKVGMDSLYIFSNLSPYEDEHKYKDANATYKLGSMDMKEITRILLAD
ncbi:MAG: HAD family hydrolase [Lachnospiraceae bacterium]|nr:HAD family hydrolase [Lachnospiraceae bacterium]